MDKTERRTVGAANSHVLRHRTLRLNEEPSSVGEIAQSLLAQSPTHERVEPATTEGREARLWREAQVPKRHERNMQTKPTPPGWVEKHDKIVGLTGSGYLFALTGIRGTGKTQIGVNAIVHNIKLSRPARYIAAMRFFLEVRATFKSEVDTELAALDKFIEPNLLVLDEWQERGETEWEDRLLGYVINERYAALKDTVLISNLEPDKFAESAGPSIMSRLTECGGLIKCDWPSFRSLPTGGV